MDPSLQLRAFHHAQHWTGDRTVDDRGGEELHALSEHVGVLYDLHELSRHLGDREDGAGLEEYLEEVLQLIERESRRLFSEARPLAGRIYAEEPEEFLLRMGRYWEIWKSLRG